MAGASAYAGRPWDKPIAPKKPGYLGRYPDSKSSFKQAYSSGVDQQAQDYDDMMGGYRGIMKDFGPGGNDPYASLKAKYENEGNQPDYQYSPITAAQQTYNRTPEMGTAFNTLNEYSRTGGLNDTEVGNLRARAVSPIRSAYANSMREMNRNKSIQGGYSPNFNAASAKMTRDQSGMMAGALTDANAGIAEMQQKGRLAMAPQYANLAAGENELQANIGSRNTAAMNEASQANAVNSLRAYEANKNKRLSSIEGLTNLTTHGQGQRLGALQGMTSLYGTTPALANTFGNQAAEAARIKESAKSSNRAAGGAMINNYTNQGRGRAKDPWGRW